MYDSKELSMLLERKQKLIRPMYRPLILAVFLVCTVLSFFALNVTNNVASFGAIQPKIKPMNRVFAPSHLLEHLLVVVSFHWEVTKLIYLEQVLNEVAAYRTKVDVLIVTDRKQAVTSALYSWGRQAERVANGHSLAVWQADPSLAPPAAADGEVVKRQPKYGLLWAHRAAIEHQLRSVGHDYSAVVYIEDDTRLSWPAVVSWALDTEILEPRNMLRCIFRTEVGASDGRPAMLDWIKPLNLNKANVLDVQIEKTGSIHGQPTGQPMALSAEGGIDRSKSEALCGKLTLRDGLPWSCAPHKWYILPEYPFQGMWAASRTQLDAFMKHPFWKEENALRANLSRPLGYPERSNGMNLFINVEPGLTSACAVPIVLKKRFSHGSPAAVGLLGSEVSLAPVSAVEHMRNGYSGGRFGHGKLPVDQAVVSKSSP